MNHGRTQYTTRRRQRENSRAVGGFAPHPPVRVQRPEYQSTELKGDDRHRNHPKTEEDATIVRAVPSRNEAAAGLYIVVHEPPRKHALSLPSSRFGSSGLSYLFRHHSQTLPLKSATP